MPYFIVIAENFKAVHEAGHVSFTLYPVQEIPFIILCYRAAHIEPVTMSPDTGTRDA
jgi:hypothetical protein